MRYKLFAIGLVGMMVCVIVACTLKPQYPIHIHDTETVSVSERISASKLPGSVNSLEFSTFMGGNTTILYGDTTALKSWYFKGERCDSTDSISKGGTEINWE